MTLTPHDALLKRYKPQPSPSALLVDSEVGAQVGSAGAYFVPKIHLYSTSHVPRMYLASTFRAYMRGSSRVLPGQ